MKKASIVILTAGFLVSGVGNNAQSAPPQKTSEQKASNPANQPQPAFRPIAIGRQRISREEQTITISRGNCDVLRRAGGNCQDVVSSYFTELVIAKMVDDFSLFARKDAQKLNGLTVSLARDAIVPARWNIFSGGASDA